uniref:ATP-dependent DNA helicase n=1 Tax=Eubacterium cellulosolvens TaxID=29322 RepID=UPI0004807272|nr:ATP-dependent DNA helicase [[Eubacterium] cellulosolvens]
MDKENQHEHLPEVKVSVRSLVEFILRSGDLNQSRGGWADREAMQAGSRIHRKIQKGRGAGYRAEVALKYTACYADFRLTVEGRADGVYEDGRYKEKQGTVVEEIKGVYADPEKFEEPVPVHLAQAKCYACILGMQQKLEEIHVCMTYVNLETEREHRFFSDHTISELKEWFEKLLDEYSRWVKFRVDWEQMRNQSMQGLEFPFPYRKGQRELVVDVYRTILREKQLFVQAPTGIGKTMSTVFPSVRALGEKKADKIFYLTAKTITRSVAQEAFRTLAGHGLRIKALTITAKEKICACEETECVPDRCPRAKGHFDRVNDALYEMITTQEDFGREAVERQAEKWNVCPYEMQIDLADFADAVICDYNYVFDPNARLKRFFGETAPKGNYVFLIDEAHNLVERGREMFSAGLYESDFLRTGKMIRAFRRELDRKKDADLYRLTGRLDRALKNCVKTMENWRESCSGCSELSNLGDFSGQLLSLTAILEDVMGEMDEREERKLLLDFYFSVSAFGYVEELYDENYLIYNRLARDGDFFVKLFCVNPASNLQDCLNKGRTAVFFSATMLPVRYYEKLLTSKEDSYAVYIDSPFDVSRRFLAIGTDVSSRYTRRTHDEFVRIASYIQLVTEKKRGNYLVFFPSYQMMEEVADIYLNDFADPENPFEEDGGPGTKVECLLQTPAMDERDREEFLERFQREREGTLIGFCVLGGIFSEGIDLKGDYLIGVLVVGTGLPQIGDERELLRSYYDRKGMNGFDYAYRFPGMNKVLQAAGRVIRTTGDRGVIALLDERFAYREYREQFPREWADARKMTLRNAGEQIQSFWNGENVIS